MREVVDIFLTAGIMVGVAALVLTLVVQR